MEPVDTSDLKSDAFGHAGSSPAVLTSDENHPAIRGQAPACRFLFAARRVFPMPRIGSRDSILDNAPKEALRSPGLLDRRSAVTGSPLTRRLRSRLVVRRSTQCLGNGNRCQQKTSPNGRFCSMVSVYSAPGGCDSSSNAILRDCFGSCPSRVHTAANSLIGSASTRLPLKRMPSSWMGSLISRPMPPSRSSSDCRDGQV